MQIDWQGTGQGRWPQSQELLITSKQVRQGFDQLALQAFAKSRHGQQPTVLQATGVRLQHPVGVIQVCQCRAEQTVAQAIALQGIEDKGFFIGQRRFGCFKEHLQSLAEEMSHRVAQEILQLPKTQRLLLDVDIEYRVVRRWPAGLMEHLPLTGIAEQGIALVEVTGTEGLQRMLLGHGLK
ncbi:hypothetical protein D9M73_201120 [compost metagenome]